MDLFMVTLLICITKKSSMYVRQFRANLYFYPGIASHPRWITL